MSTVTPSAPQALPRADRRWLIGLAVSCLLWALTATPALAAPATTAPRSIAGVCSDAGSSPLDELGELRCSSGADTAQEAVEAALAAAGVVVFTAAALLYRRRRRNRPAGGDPVSPGTQSG